MLHHVSIRTAHIHRSIAFYECLGFTMAERFTTGYTLACWLQGRGSRLELIQIPEPQPAADAFHDEHYVGYYHLSFDLAGEATNLPTWLADFGAKLSECQDFQLEAKLLLKPHQQAIGDRIYEVAFVADPDGLPIELLL
jgi:catechol 2,3-dioxygenase-like lactoylglutathione lyase family enzyme